MNYMSFVHSLLQHSQSYNATITQNYAIKAPNTRPPKALANAPAPYVSAAAAVTIELVAVVVVVLNTVVGEGVRMGVDVSSVEAGMEMDGVESEVVGSSVGSENDGDGSELVVSSGGGSVKVLVSPGSVMVEVKVSPGRVVAPPGPSHVAPMGQQPYSPLSPSQQMVVASQPPAPSGQQVYVRGIQPSPQSFSPWAEHGSSTVWRLRRAG